MDIDNRATKSITTTSSVYLQKLNSAPNSVTNKDYVKNLLLNKYIKKYAGDND